jgi:hypothetical protein
VLSAGAKVEKKMSDKPFVEFRSGIQKPLPLRSNLCLWNMLLKKSRRYKIAAGKSDYLFSFRKEFVSSGCGTPK